MTQKKQWSDYSSGEKRAVKIVLGVLSAIIVLVIFSVAFSPNDQPNTEPEKAKLSATVLKQEVLGPANLRVYYEVENMSDVTTKPSCTINARSANGTYEGLDIFSLDDLPAKEVDIFKSDLVITNEGAQHVTDVTVSCK